MRLSNKSTFSLACLILLLALGVVFGTTSVMAHPHLDDPDTTDVDESDVDHSESDHPTATITLTSANDSSFTEDSIIGTTVVRLLNGAAVDLDNDGTDDIEKGGRFADPRATDRSTAGSEIVQDATGLFKLRIEFSQDLDVENSNFAAADIVLTAVGSTTPQLDTTTVAWVQTPAFVAADDDTTSYDDTKRVIEAEVLIPVATYGADPAELPITVYASVRLGVVGTNGVQTAPQVINGEPVAALFNLKSDPLDATFTVVDALLPSDAPANFTAVSANTETPSVTLAFDLVTNAEKYQYSKDGGANWEDIPAASVMTDGVSHVVTTGLMNGIAYTFQVRAVRGSQIGMAASTTPATLTPMFPAPAAPTMGDTGTGDGQVTLQWTAVANADSYEYRQSSNGGTTWGDWMAIPGDGTTDSHVVTGLTNGDTYDFEVRAVRTNALDGMSSSISATPVGPDVPITITPGSMIKSVMHGGGEIGLPTKGEVITLTLESTVNPDGKITVVGGVTSNPGYTVAASSTTDEYTLSVLVNQLTSSVTISAMTGYELRQIDPESTATTPMPEMIDDFVIMVDKTGPTVTITTPSGLPAEGGAFNVTLTFDETLASVPTDGNFDVINGKIGNFIKIDDVTYLATVTPDHGVHIGNTDAMKQSVEIRIKNNLMDEHGNASMATAADADADAIFMPAKATIADAAFDSASPASGNIAQGGTIEVTFTEDPGTVTATGGTITTSGKTRTITVSSTQAAGALEITLTWRNAADTENLEHELNYTVTVDERELATANSSAAFDVPGESFVIVVRDLAAANAEGLDFSATAPNATVVEWPGMPDLHDVFNTDAPHGGGALILTESAAQPSNRGRNPGTVGISEIMWALDDGFFGDGQLRDRASQWIELHNLNTNQNRQTPVPDNPDDGNAIVVLSYKTGAKALEVDDIVKDNLAAGELDVVTNVFNERPGNPLWKVPGNNGDSIAGTSFTSMARRGEFSLSATHDGKHNKRYTKTGVGNAGNSPDGRNKDQWAASTNEYLRFRTGVQGDTVRIAYEFIGTPGRVNTFSPERATVRDARTDIPASPIIINEVANRDDANSQYEWIELKNVSDAEVNLNNYQISILTAVDKDEPFIFLPNNNNSKIPAGGVLLLVDSDPFGDDDHPLAVGWKIGKDAEIQVPGLESLGINATSKHGRYLVVPFGGKNNKFITGLPDDGNFILVVRSADSHNHEHGHGDRGRAELGAADLGRITDIAGYAGTLTKNGYTNSVSKTDLWPLKEQRTGALISDRNKLTANIVHDRRRNGRNGLAGVGTTHNDRNEGQVAYQHAGYTGIGYKRQATNSPKHGGTPGYDNGARKGRVSDLATTKLVISEIMLSQGAEGIRTTLPQWIEIYNPSPHPVNLGGWRLIIENPRDPIRTINLGGGTVKTILSKQTILVVSGSARDFGSGNLVSAAAKVFPSTRVYSVYQHQKNEFNMDSRFDPILNQEAFHITLIDGAALDLSKPEQKAIADDPTKSLRVSGKYYTISDVIGNLDGDPRTNDTPEDNGKMAFPMGMTADGNRTSFIRIFDKGVARDGTLAVKPLGGTDGVGVARMKGIDAKYGWVHAADTVFAYANDNIRATTWYGARSDSGTPLNRIGQILPVELSSFRPTLADGKVTIRWTTESELDNAGFNILRSETRNGEFKQVNTELIQGAGTTGERNTYKWVDPTAKPGVVYYYQIEDVSFAGEHQVLAITKLKGLISAQGKLTTTWSELKQASQ